MAEQKKDTARPVEAASAAPGERRAAVRPLARASESGHGDVHQALGNLETARRNLEAARAEGKEDPDAEAADAEARGQLRELGFG